MYATKTLKFKIITQLCILFYVTLSANNLKLPKYLYVTVGKYIIKNLIFSRGIEYELFCCIHTLILKGNQRINIKFRSDHSKLIKEFCPKGSSTNDFCQGT